jgi:hypothetical protein
MHGHGAPDVKLSHRESRQGQYHRPEMLPRQRWADRGYPSHGYPVQGYDRRHLGAAAAAAAVDDDNGTAIHTTVHTADGGVAQFEILPRAFLAVDAHAYPCVECCKMY